MVSLSDIQFPVEPCLVHCIGGSGVGKSHLMKDILLNEKSTFAGPIQHHYYCYEFWQVISFCILFLETEYFSRTNMMNYEVFWGPEFLFIRVSMGQTFLAGMV